MAAVGSFGFLTLAYDAASLRRARAMARSLRRHEPHAPIALLAAFDCSDRPEEFDDVAAVDRPEPFAGAYRFFNKLVALGRHAPFARNFFLDDDVLVLGPLIPTIESAFVGRPFALNCDLRPADAPFSGPNHIDPAAIATEFGVEEVMDPYGGGHLYFERPACEVLFREAVELVLFEPERYRRLSGDGFLSDEVALAVVAHRHGISLPALDGWIDPFDRPRAAPIQLDLVRGVYRFPGRDRGADGSTRLLHFCADGKNAPAYLRALENVLDQGSKRRGVLRSIFATSKRGEGR